MRALSTRGATGPVAARAPLLRLRAAAAPARALGAAAAPQLRAAACRVRAAGDKESSAVAERAGAESNLGDFCSIDGKGAKVERTTGEMEQEFLGALASYYYEGKAVMSDDEFNLLKDELLWRGSSVPVLDGEEQRFLEAAIAYSKGTPIMSDADYDKLKTGLRSNNSVVTAQGPRCSIRSRKMYSDAQIDYAKMTLLNMPGVLIVLGVMYGADFLSGFELTAAIELPPPLGIGLLWGIVLPAAFVLSSSITNILLRDALILKGACPSCGTETFSYFGEVMSIAPSAAQNVIDCPSCNACLVFDATKRRAAAAAAAAAPPHAQPSPPRAPPATRAPLCVGEGIRPQPP